MRRHFADLYLFRAFGNAIAAVMAINMLKRHMARIADAAVGLNGLVGRLANQTIGAVIAHRHFIGQINRHFGFAHRIHLRRGFINQIADHFGFRMQLGERKLNGLIARQGFAERRAGFGIGDAFIDAILRRAHATGGLANAVFMDKMLRQSEPLPGGAKHRAFWHPNIGKRYARMVGRHIERPHIFFDFDPRVIGRHQKAGDAARRAIVARGACKYHHMTGDMHARRPHFLAIDKPAIDAIAGFAHAARFHPRGIRAMRRFGKAKANAMRAAQHAVDKCVGLFGRAEITKHQNLGYIANNRAFVLQIIMQPQAFGGQMLPDYGHG